MGPAPGEERCLYCSCDVSCCPSPAVTHRHPAWAALAVPGQGMCPWVSGDVPVFLHSNESCVAFPWSWLGVLSLAHCQVLQVWEENLVPGENLFIK